MTTSAGEARLVKGGKTDEKDANKTMGATRSGGKSSNSNPNPQKISKPKSSRPPKQSRQERLIARVGQHVYDQRPSSRWYVVHWLYFWLYCNVGLYKFGFMPEPKKPRRDHLKSVLEEIYDLTLIKKLYLAVINSKGGAGKTTFATWAAVILQMFGRRKTIAVDANENSGGTARRLGVDRDIEPVLRLRNWIVDETICTYETYENAVGHHRETGTVVIASDPNSDKQFTEQQFVTRSDNMKTVYWHVVNDVGNGLPHAANSGAVKSSNVVVLCASSDMADSLDDINPTRDFYASRPNDTEKMSRALYVLLGVNPAERERWADKFGCDPEQIRFVGRDRFMARRKAAVVSWRKLRLRTKIELAEIVRDLLMLAPDVETFVPREESEIDLPTFEAMLGNAYHRLDNPAEADSADVPVHSDR